MKTVALVLLSLFLFAGLAGCASKSKADGPPVFTRAQAEKIAETDILSYKDAVAIIGSPANEVLSQNGNMTYKWENPDGTYIQLQYKKDELISKDIYLIK